MSVAIIISTHGSAAEHILKATEMILGSQNNVYYINFFSNENLDILKEKYNKCIESLENTFDVLFLVDIWGGSPFNAANQIVYNKKNYNIITGVNIPMILEIFMLRNKNSSIKEITEIALKTGQSEIKSIKDYEIVN